MGVYPAAAADKQREPHLEDDRPTAGQMATPKSRMGRRDAGRDGVESGPLQRGDCVSLAKPYSLFFKNLQIDHSLQLPIGATGQQSLERHSMSHSRPSGTPVSTDGHVTK